MLNTLISNLRRFNKSAWIRSWKIWHISPGRNLGWLLYERDPPTPRQFRDGVGVILYCRKSENTYLFKQFSFHVSGPCIWGSKEAMDKKYCPFSTSVFWSKIYRRQLDKRVCYLLIRHIFLSRRTGSWPLIADHDIIQDILDQSQMPFNADQ